MSNWIVENRLTGEVVHAYVAEVPDHFTDYPLEQFNHILQKPVVEPAPKRRVTKLDFVKRLGDDVFDYLLLMAKSSIGIEKFVKLIDWATPEADGTSIDLDDPRVQALRGLEPMLIAAGKAEAGWADGVLA
jgi:hypothetical protein